MKNPARRRFERSVVDLLQEAGIACERLPLSGSAGGSFHGDVSILMLGTAWLSGHCELLVLKADRQQPLVVAPIALFAKLAAAAERGKAGAP